MDEREDYADHDLPPDRWSEVAAQAFLTALLGACLAGVPLMLAALRPY